MKQMVSVVEDGHVRFFVPGDDGLDEVARVKVGSRFTPEQAIQLGQLIEAVRVNGTKKVAGGKRKPAVKRQDRSHITFDAVLDAVSALDGGMVSDIADKMGLVEDDRKTLGNRLRSLVGSGRLTSTRQEDGRYRYQLTF